MAKLKVKYDPTLEQSELIARLENSSPDEEGKEYDGNQTDLQQTLIYGLQCPIIAVNDIIIAYEDIISFELNDSHHVPTVSIHVYDRQSLIQYLETPRNDNELRVQILPPFDDVYKKINLTFLITNYSMGSNNDLFINGTYKLSALTSSQFKSFGEISLYDLFDKIAGETKLGFTTNVEQTDDKRFVYCPYTSYLDTISEEIEHSGDQTTIYDWWIDVWNYLSLANIYERYNAHDSEEDMTLWISGKTDDITEGTKIEPQKVKGELTDLFGAEESQVFVKSYRTITNPGLNVRSGVDKVYSIYSMKDREYKDTYISDGDVKKDVYTNYEYLGEVYGEYDYITNGMYREPYLQKIHTNLVEVDLRYPLLGLIRGNQVVFASYYNDDSMDFPINSLEENGLVNSDIKINANIDGPDGTTPDTFKLDRSVSGQYLILGNIYRFENHEWTQTVILARPATETPEMVPDEEDNASITNTQIESNTNENRVII